MTRPYTLKRRAEQQAETRQRIAEAALDLHGSLGPGQTTLSMVAERAGVQRHTLYAHFPDERSLFFACSGLATERDPMPDAEPWRTIDDPRARLGAGLAAIYAWYERNASLTACVVRDAEYHPLTREIAAMRSGPYFDAYRAVLGEKLTARQQAMLALAVTFHTWRTLVDERGLTSEAAAGLMTDAVAGA